MSTPLTLPPPSDPSSRYFQGRVGERAQGSYAAEAVWTVTLDATGGLWFAVVYNGNQPLIKVAVATSTVSPVASAATMQTFLEGQCGTGNVTVTGGPGASGGGTPYVITFTGDLKGQPIWISSTSTFMAGGGATATLVETTRGGVTGATVPIGPTLSTNDAEPANGPVAREA